MFIDKKINFLNYIFNSASPGSTGTNPISNVGLPAKFDVFNTC